MTGARHAEWRQGWPVVGAGLTGMTLMALHAGPLGLMIKPLGETFGWSRGQVAGGLTVITFAQLLLVPLAALALPRLGARRLALAGAVTYLLGLGALGFCTPSIWSWYFGWAIIGLGLAGVGPLVWTAVVTRAFERHRGLALSVALSGVGLATTITPLVAALALERFGWRAPFLVLSAAGFCLLLPLLVWLTSLRPAFGPEPRADAAAVTTPVRLRDVATEPRVWVLVCASLMIAGAAGFLTTHLQTILRDAGVPAMTAAGYYALTGPSLIAGRLLSGVLLDRLPSRMVASGMFILPAVAALILIHGAGSPIGGVAACVAFGVGYGSDTDILAYLTSRYFPRERYAVVYALVYGLFGVGFGTAALVGGSIYDAMGSYAPVLYVLIGAVAVGVAFIARLGPTPPLERADEPTVPTANADTAHPVAAPRGTTPARP